MKRKTVVRNVTLGAVATVAPVAGFAAPVGAEEKTPADRCLATFGERGPVARTIAGEGPPGDPMTVTVGWEPNEWPEGLREVITCVSLDGKALPGLTRLTVSPPNAGNIAVDLTLPHGPAGSLVCQQSILVGTGSTEGRTRQTEGVCFKLRAAEEMLASPDANTSTSATPASAEPAVPVPNTHPANPPTPPARTAAANAMATTPSRMQVAAPAVRSVPRPAPAPVAAPAPAPTPAPEVQAPRPTRVGQAADELARTPADTGTLAAPAPASAAPATAATPEAARAALPHTGVNDHIPLAAAGGLMALGGASIIMGAPKRKTRRA